MVCLGNQAGTAAGARSVEAQRLCPARDEGGSLQRLVWKLGLWRWTWAQGGRCKSRHGLRVGCESLDLFDPVGEVGDIGEDAGVDGCRSQNPSWPAIRTQEPLKSQTGAQVALGKRGSGG